MPPSPKKVVVIGGGASGVFTAYLLNKQAPGEFDVTIVEKHEKVGGHAHSVVYTVDGENVSIDHGAQFFSETAQPQYCDLLRAEGLFDVPGLIREAPAGVTIWDSTQQSLSFRIPDSLGGILAEAIQPDKVFSWIAFVEMTLQAKLLYELGDWNLTFGDWVQNLWLPGVSPAEVADFKQNVLRPLMYQFGLVPPQDLDSLSAKFVVYYFLGSLPAGLEGAAFTVYNSMEGLDGILSRILDQNGLTPIVRTGKTVTSLEENGDKWNVSIDDGTSIEADEVVFATNPMQVLSILPDTATYAGVRAVLDDLEFVDVQIRIQHPDPAYMPTDEADWSVSNITVADTNPLPGPTNYMLSVWFGPMRDEGAGELFFKSWGSPSLLPANAAAEAVLVHQLMVGHPLFMSRRAELREDHQGKHSLWYVGGWIIDYDSQNAALRSAMLVVGQILEKHGIEPLEPEFLMARVDLAAQMGAPRTLADLELPARFELLEAIRNEIVTQLPDHPAVRLWLNRLREQ